MPRLDLVTVADSRYEVLARLPKSKVDDVEREKSLYFGADTILQSGDVLLVCRKVIDVEYEEL